MFARQSLIKTKNALGVSALSALVIKQKSKKSQKIKRMSNA